MKKPLELHERARILKLRAKGMSILSISKELHRSKRTVSAFIKDPVSYLKSIVNGENIASSSSGSDIPYDKLIDSTPKKKTNTGETSSSSSPAAKVSLEQRCIIKYLTKKGWNAPAIQDDMKRVYKGSTPSLNAIEHWIKECTENPTINFYKKNDKLWVKKAKANIKKATTKKTENSNDDNNDGNDNTSKVKEKVDKGNSSKNLITLKLFANNAIKSRISS